MLESCASANWRSEEANYSLQLVKKESNIRVGLEWSKKRVQAVVGVHFLTFDVEATFRIIDLDTKGPSSESELG